jgi:mRNA interferase MazF
MSQTSEPRPKHGWIYMVNPYRVFLSCRNGHRHFYDLGEPTEISCPVKDCGETINPSQIFRGAHPYIIWTSNEFLGELKRYPVFTAIPLTSEKSTPRQYERLSTTYAIRNTLQNGLTTKSYALIHQITTIDAACFRDHSGQWLKRMGAVSKQDRERIQERLMYYFGIPEEPSDEWFTDNATPELLKKVFYLLPDSQKKFAIDILIEQLGDD